MKKRLDVILTEKGFFESREKAKAALMEGLVYVNGQREDKAGTMVAEDAPIEVRGEKLPFVSRGGLKLDKAMKTWPIDLTDTICMDIGASTGGFTDCMLQRGASKVYAVDVGYGQLAWKLRTDERVVNLEKTNARTLSRNEVPEEIDFSSIDVSFISLKKILPAVRALLKEQGHVVALIKPQFEAGREKVGKKGVVREPETHIEVVRDITEYASSNGFSVLGLTYSPVKGPEGNIEYLIYLEKAEPGSETLAPVDPAAVVAASHEALSGQR